MAKRILRPKEIQRRLGIGASRFWEEIVGEGRLRLKRLGPRSVGALEEDVDALIDSMPDDARAGRGMNAAPKKLPPASEQGRRT